LNILENNKVFTESEQEKLRYVYIPLLKESENSFDAVVAARQGY